MPRLKSRNRRRKEARRYCHLSIKKIVLMGIVLSLLLVSVSTASAASGDLAWLNDLDIVLITEQKLGIPYEQYKNLSQTQQDLLSEAITLLNNENSLFNVENGMLVVSVSEAPTSLRPVLAVLNRSKLMERNRSEHKDSGDGLQIQSTAPWPGAYSWYTYQVKSRAITYPSGLPIKIASRSLSWQSPTPHRIEAGDETAWSFSGTLSLSGGVTTEYVEASASIQIGYTFTASVRMYIEGVLQPGQKVDAYRVTTYVRETISYDGFYWEDWDHDGTGDWCLWVGVSQSIATNYQAHYFYWDNWGWLAQ
ncbi:MAG: hypothetical protein FD169_2527 [Bacillota bacterium]|nr:MAG: hypothetical protein FD169_2527 [Bacillota bacterium]